jgi:hypothetical protein
LEQLRRRIGVGGIRKKYSRTLDWNLKSSIGRRNSFDKTRANVAGD